MLLAMAGPEGPDGGPNSVADRCAGLLAEGLLSSLAPTETSHCTRTDIVRFMTRLLAPKLGNSGLVRFPTGRSPEELLS